MLNNGQRVLIAESITMRWRDWLLMRGVRGKRATIKERVASYSRYYRLNEFPGLVFNEYYLIPLDDNDEAAFDRFMNKIDLTPRNLWTEKL